MPGVPHSKGCDACRKAKKKCDELQPCSRCQRLQLPCEGSGMQRYKFKNADTSVNPAETKIKRKKPRAVATIAKPNILPCQALPKALAPGPQVEHSAEQTALEFFFLKSAPQLASFFSHAFFQKSVLQRSFTEPAVRQAMGAIGFLHEHVAHGQGRISERKDRSHSKSGFHIQLYNRSIRSIIKASQDLNSLPQVIMVSILFACFELLNRNPSAAAAHIKSGIDLLNSWRVKANQKMILSGRKESTPESRFLEEEIAPLMSILDLNMMGAESEKGNRTQFMLNPIVKGRVRLKGHFESLDEAKVALIDIIAAAMGHPKSNSLGQDKEHKDETDIQPFLLPTTGIEAMGMWSQAFDDMVLQHEHSWDKREQRSGNALYLTRLSLNLSALIYQVESECDWDKYLSDYEDVLRVCEAIISDCEELMDYFTQMVNLDSALIYAFHFGAWKCRWPKIRQQCLDLILRIPKREWDFEAKHFYQIFARIKEKEEAYLTFPVDSGAMSSRADAVCLPPEHVRVHDFTVEQPRSLAGSTFYEVSFWTKPEGAKGEWHISTELIDLELPRATSTVVPSNLLPRKV